MGMTKIWSQTQMKICELHMTAKKNDKYLHMKIGENRLDPPLFGALK